MSMPSTIRRRWSGRSPRPRRVAVPADRLALVYARATGGIITDPHTDSASVLDAIAIREATHDATLVEELFNAGRVEAAEALARHLGMLEASDRTLATLEEQGATR